MGPHYDNEKGQHEFSDEVMNSHWLLHQDSLMVYLIPKDGQGFDTCGPDEDVEAQLNQFSDEQLADEALMAENGFEIVHSWHRRFCPEAGYYLA